MNNVRPNLLPKEILQRYRSIDQLLTVYERLHQRYSLLSRALEFLFLITSLVLCLTTFIDPNLLKLLQIPIDHKEMLLGISAFLSFLIALTMLLVNWKKKAAQYLLAEERLRIAKAECQELLRMEPPEDLARLQLKSLEYLSVISHLPKIPVKDFHRFAAYHKRRLELNRMIERYPGGSVRLLKIFVYFRANLHAMLRKPFLNPPPGEVKTEEGIPC